MINKTKHKNINMYLPVSSTSLQLRAWFNIYLAKIDSN